MFPPYRSPFLVGKPQIKPHGTSAVAEALMYQSSGSRPVSLPCTRCRLLAPKLELMLALAPRLLPVVVVLAAAAAGPVL